MNKNEEMFGLEEEMDKMAEQVAFHFGREKGVLDHAKLLKNLGLLDPRMVFLSELEAKKSWAYDAMPRVRDMRILRGQEKKKELIQAQLQKIVDAYNEISRVMQTHEDKL